MKNLLALAAALLVSTACDDGASKSKAGDPETKTPDVVGADKEPPPPKKTEKVKKAPPTPGGPMLFIRIGKKDEPAIAEAALDFDGNKDASVTLDVAGKPYSFTIASQPVTGRSMYKTKWNLVFFRGKNGKGKKLARMILNDPAETGSFGGCNSHMDYANSDNLWFEVGVRGKEHAAKKACAALKPRR